MEPGVSHPAPPFDTMWVNQRVTRREEDRIAGRGGEEEKKSNKTIRRRGQSVCGGVNQTSARADGGPG